MPLRYLFGPVSRAFCDDILSRQRQAGECLSFHHFPGADFRLEAADSWSSFQARFSSGWQPDAIVLYLPYRTVPSWLWSAPVPIVGLAGDWNLLWHTYRAQLRRCDLVLTDTFGVEQLRKDGHKHLWTCSLYGAPRSLAEASWPGLARDIDILFVGNFEGTVQRDRLPWLARLARLAERCNVVLTTNVHGEEYRHLLARAKIVFNRGVRGEWNLRVGEALASGALLFQEADNREVPLQLADRRECVLYTADNLEGLLRYYLEHDEQRQALAAAAQARLPEFTFEQLWSKTVTKIERHLPELRERVKSRATFDTVAELEARTLQCLNTTDCYDPNLPMDLQAALAAQPRSARLHYCLGLVLGWPPHNKPEVGGAVAEAFQDAWTSDPRHLLAGLNLAEVLAEQERKGEAQEQAKRTLAMLDRGEAWPRAFCDAVPYRCSFDEYRVAWEKAAWEHAGARRQEICAKRTLLRWRLHTLLGSFTGDPGHLYEAVQARPDLADSRSALGRVLAGRQRWAEAVRHLKHARNIDPFDAGLARTLHQVLKLQGDVAGLHLLVRDQMLLHRAAPAIIPEEPWFASKSLPERCKVAQPVFKDEFHQRYGHVDCFRALHGFTPPRDTEIVLTLVKHFQPKRLLEIGTAAGHMTANLSEWSLEEAKIVSLGITAGMPGSVASAPAEQRAEDPPATAFGAHADHFNKAHKVTLIPADSLTFDFARLGPIDFAFIDGAHDVRHVWSDSRKAYDILTPGGLLVWHDFNSTTPWVEVRQALEQLPFREAVEYVEGTEVAFLRKASAAADFDRDPHQPPLRLVWEGG